MELESKLESKLVKEFEGHITAEFKFNVIDIFRRHFKVHNIVVVSFRKDMIIVQTMTKPYEMPNVDTKGLYTTIIPLSSMDEYDFDCNYDEVNVMISKALLVGGFKSRCINIVKGENLMGNDRSYVEVTFDWFGKDSDIKVRTKISDSLGFHLSKPYPHFWINSALDYPIREDYSEKLNGEIQTVLVTNPKAFKSFYSTDFRIFVGGDSIVFDNCNPGFGTRFGIGDPNGVMEFEVPSEPFKGFSSSLDR